jgi:hypothetical protein
MEKMRGGMKLPAVLRASAFLKKCEGLFPGKMTKLCE